MLNRFLGTKKASYIRKPSAIYRRRRKGKPGWVDASAAAGSFEGREVFGGSVSGLEGGREGVYRQGVTDEEFGITLNARNHPLEILVKEG